jgi:hypothetical protein
MAIDSKSTDVEMKAFFDRFYQKQITFPSNQIDAVVGFFKKRGFDDLAANSTSIILLTQAKVDNINPFKLIDTLKGLTDVQLSQIVTEVLNLNREKTSTLGFKLETIDETTESRNILP